MSKVIQLPDNPIGRADRDRLESFGGHCIALGRATRWHWGQDAEGDPVFEIYRGGANAQLVASISRDRARDVFRVQDDMGGRHASGGLEYVLAVLDAYLARLHRGDPGPAA